MAPRANFLGHGTEQRESENGFAGIRDGNMYESLDSSLGNLQQHVSARTLNFVKTDLLPDSVLVVTGVSAAGTVARTEKGRSFPS